MAHDPTGKSDVHSEKGMEGLGMAWGHKLGRMAARVVARLPFVIGLVRNWDTTGGKAVGGTIRSVAGYFNLPLGGVWGARLNALMDAFVYEVAEVLEEDADRPIEEILKDGALMSRLNAKAEDFFGKKAWLVNELVHDDKECTIFKSLTKTETRQGKDGKEFTVNSKFAVVELTVARAIKERIDFCPKCFPAGTSAAQKREAKPAAPKKASPADICGQYVDEAKDDIAERQKREDQVAVLWQRVALVSDPELRDRIDALNTRAELTMLLAAKDQVSFEELLKRLEEPGLGRAVNKITRDIRKGIDNGIDRMNAAAATEIPRIDAETSALKRRMALRKGGEFAATDGTIVKVERESRFKRFFRTLFEDLI